MDASEAVQLAGWSLTCVLVALRRSCGALEMRHLKRNRALAAELAGGDSALRLLLEVRTCGPSTFRTFVLLSLRVLKRADLTLFQLGPRSTCS